MKEAIARKGRKQIPKANIKLLSKREIQRDAREIYEARTDIGTKTKGQE